jgi:hypothetical protein
MPQGSDRLSHYPHAPDDPDRPERPPEFTTSPPEEDDARSIRCGLYIFVARLLRPNVSVSLYADRHR